MISEEQVKVQAQDAAATATTTATPTETYKELAGWEHIPLQKDGWSIAHESIRRNTTELLEVAEAIVHHAEKGNLAVFMADSLKVLFDVFSHAVHHHHDNEEKIVFPPLRKRAKELGKEMPESMSTDHEGLLRLLEDSEKAFYHVSKLIRENSSDLNADAARTTIGEAAKAAKAKLAELDHEMRPHLEFEERHGLPLLRSVYTRAEFKPIEAEIVKGMKDMDLGWLLRYVDTDEQRKEWMTKIAGIPSVVVNLKFWPVVRKGGVYDQTISRHAWSIKAGEYIVPQKGKCSIL